MYGESKPNPLLAMFGLREEDYEDTEGIVEIYEDNWDTFNLFNAMSTQWRVGMSGATGLDYNVIPILSPSLDIPDSEMKDVIFGLRIMESEAMKTMAEEREKRQK